MQLNTGIREIFNLNLCDNLGNSQFDYIITGSYDGIIRVFDPRDFTNPIAFYDTNCTIYSMCMQYPLLVFALHNSMIGYFDLRKFTTLGQFVPETIYESPLNYNIHSMSAFHNSQGFALISPEGKCSINYINLDIPPEIDLETKKLVNPDTTKNFVFRCHRKNNSSPSEEITLISQVKFNPVYGTFATAGGDGTYGIWDYLSKSILKKGSFPNSIPITAIDYSMDGNLLAYAGGYDWSDGDSLSQKYQPQIAIRYLKDEEKLQKPPAPTNSNK